MEWRDRFNAFNSDKVLAWRDRFEAIMKGEIPAPVSVTIDASNYCSLHCKFCQYSEFRKEKQTMISKEDLMWLVDTIPKLGAKSVCLAGGGEYLLHPNAGESMRRLKDNGINIGLITNGLAIDKFMEDILYSCRWVGNSIDAATTATYKELKGAKDGDFFHVLENLKLLARLRPNRRSPSIGFKFLIHPMNYHELLDAAKLAKSLGVDDFHARPGYGKDIFWEKQMITEALSQVKTAQRLLDDENFHVYGVTHKFDETFNKKIVDKCEVTPIAGLTFTADGWVSICCDLRNTEMGRLCEWRDILDVWGSKMHRKVLSQLDPKKCPRRCTFNSYEEILEKVFKEDRMCYAFP